MHKLSEFEVTAYKHPDGGWVCVNIDLKFDEHVSTS